ncbi:T9SS type A sorting domain-containing protein [Polaribacter sp. R77954]|uniref:T9SS type A sorting domain-containing protein n=1 Tax=Polaribacter sp. R77954 TaxID=3093870 RepID=UPI0037C73F20
MMKKIMFFLFVCSSIHLYSQTDINNFEPGDEAVTIQGGNLTLSTEANPSISGLNTSANSLKIGRASGSTAWWAFATIDVVPDIAIAAAPTDTKYLSMLVYYTAQPDIGVRTSAGESDNGGNAMITRALNEYNASESNTWQRIVFEVKTDGDGVHSFTTGTMYKILFHPDMGFNNTPSGQLLSTSTFGYIDNIVLHDTNPLINTWLGTTSDWNTASNWSRGTVPLINDFVTIPSGTSNDPVISSTSGVVIERLTVDSGASLTIENGGSLIVHGTSSGNITYKRTLTKDADLSNAWYAVSPPVAGATVTTLKAENNFAAGSGGDRIGLATYANDGSAWNYFTTSSSDAIASGTGLIAKIDNGAANSDLLMTGTYVGINVEPTISQSTNNFNFVGNPFTAYLNLGTFFTDNNAADRLTEETIWIWDENKNGVNMGGYVSKTSALDGSFEIAPGQGFFVSSGSATDNKVTFNVANRSHKSDSFLKNANDRTEISLSIMQNNKTFSTDLYYLDGASVNFDNGFDASMFTGVTYDLEIYSNLVSGDNKSKIERQSLPKANFEDMVVPLGIKASKGVIEIAATSKNLPKGISVFLEDRLTNTFTNVTDSSLKVTLSNNVDNSGRFFLRTSSQNALSTNNSKLTGARVYLNNQTLTVTGINQSTGSVSIYNILGKQITNKKFTSSNGFNVGLSSLSSGVYIVKLNTTEGSSNTKIILE